MDLDYLKSKYPGKEPAVPGYFAEPNNSEIIMNLIVNHDCNFPKSYIDFQLSSCYEIPMGDFAKEGFRWANASCSEEDSLEQLVKEFRELKFPDHLTPFKFDDEGYWCFDQNLRDDIENHRIVIFSPEEQSIVAQHKNFISWLDATMNENY